MDRQQPQVDVRIRTIGHSSRPLDGFLGLLKGHDVAMLMDVRTVPRSRYNPQYDRATLPASLEAAGIAYQHMPALGGFRHPRPDSPNNGWRSQGFRGFADYMGTPEFEAALTALIDRARETRLAIMCAEAVPWRCHRSLIADALAVRGVLVEHIVDTNRARRHAVTPWARVEGTRIAYAAPLA